MPVFPMLFHGSDMTESEEHGDLKRQRTAEANNTEIEAAGDRLTTVVVPTPDTGRFVVTAVVIWVGWFTFNDVRKTQSIDILAGTSLSFNRNPRLFGTVGDGQKRIDPLAVNIVAASGSCAGMHLGHIATVKTAPVQNKMWAHFFSALMDGDSTRLPKNLQDLSIEKHLTFSGTTLEKSTHRATGSKIAVHITSSSLHEETMKSIATYLRGADMYSVTCVKST